MCLAVPICLNVDFDYFRIVMFVFLGVLTCFVVICLLYQSYFFRIRILMCYVGDMYHLVENCFLRFCCSMCYFCNLILVVDYTK